MKTYIYKVYFHKQGINGIRYNMAIYVEANSNKEAVVLGEKRWKEQVEKRIDLQKATIEKITCRARETKRRQQKLTPIQKALSVMNRYISEN